LIICKVSPLITFYTRKYSGTRDHD